MEPPNETLGQRALQVLGLHPVAHRPPLGPRFWIYSATAYLLPLIVHLGLSGEASPLDEVVWLVTLVPAFLLSLHFGLRGAFVALLLGTGLVVGVQVLLVLGGTPGDARVTVPIYMAYGMLAISVGWLSEQLHEHYEYALEIQTAQKTEALGTMAAGIAHDFNNILTAMVANAELIGDAPAAKDGTADPALENLKTAARRGAGIVRNLLGFSRRNMLALRPFDLGVFAEEQLPLLQRLAPEPVQVRLAGDGAPAPILADRDAVERIVVSLVTNARDAMPLGGTLEITVERSRLDQEHRRRTGWGTPGDYVCLQVSDTGAGMSEETLSRIFEPFFTGKEPGEGVGLGMAMVYGLMKQHRGFIDVTSTPGTGTTVRTYFPLAEIRASDQQRTVPQDAFVEEGSVPASLETILLVEDEETIRRAATRILERGGYKVLTAADGEEAVQMYRQHAHQVDLMLTDIVLPKRSGLEAYEAIQVGYRQPKVLFMSGYPARTMQSGGGLDPSLPFLPKPWTADELTAAVREALDDGPTGAEGPNTVSRTGASSALPVSESARSVT